MTGLALPFFTELEGAQNILVAGAGGGFDVFSGLPLYFALRAAGKTVHLANLSFSHLEAIPGRWLTPALLEVTADAAVTTDYTPEVHLARWFRNLGAACACPQNFRNSTDGKTGAAAA